MINILKHRLVKKLFLLLGLMLSLVYLRSPARLDAQQGQHCLTLCQSQLKTCASNCLGNQSCILACNDAFTSCVDNCHF